MSKRKKTYTGYEIIKNIAKILVLHRVWSGLNQTKVAKDLNVTFQQIQKYEKCMNRISAEMLIDICKKRKWDITLFMNDRPEDILNEWALHVDLKDPVSAYPLRTDQIIRKWKQIDKVGEDNYYRKHHFIKHV